MLTVNLSVPEDVKDAFNTAFEGQNKSAVIADLMREAVERILASVAVKWFAQGDWALREEGVEPALDILRASKTSTTWPR